MSVLEYDQDTSAGNDTSDSQGKCWGSESKVSPSHEQHRVLILAQRRELEH